ASIGAVRQAAWSPDGRRIVGVFNGSEGQELWVGSFDGTVGPIEKQHVGAAIGWPAWTPRGEMACIATVERRSRITLPCGSRAIRIEPDRDAYGPIAFARDGGTVYVGLANGAGTLDLWAVPVQGGRARQLTSFARDAYGPSVASDGSVLFKVQSYR